MSAPDIRRQIERDAERARRAVIEAATAAHARRIYWRFRVEALRLELVSVDVQIRRERGTTTKGGAHARQRTDP